MGKALAVLLLGALTQACALSTYIGPETGPVAYLKSPESVFDGRLIPSIKQLIQVGPLTEEGCWSELRSRAVMADSFDERGYVRVPAGREIGISAGFVGEGKACYVFVAVALQEGQDYWLFHLGDSRRCAVSLSTVNNQNEIVPVPVSRLQTGILRTCKQDVRDVAAGDMIGEKE